MAFPISAAKTNLYQNWKQRWPYYCIAIVLVALGGYAIYQSICCNKLELARSIPLRIGYQKSPPYQLVYEDGTRGGVGLDIISEAANRLNLQLEWIYSPEPPDENFADGKVDLWPIVTDLPHRRENFYISKPIYENSLGLLFIESEEIQELDDLRQRRIAYYDREPGTTLTRRLLPNAELIPMPSHREAIAAVFENKCDAAFLWSTKTNSIDFEKAIAAHRGKPFRFHYFSDEKITCGIGANYNSPAAVAAADQLREEIRLLVREGFVQETYFRYFLDPENEISTYFNLDDLERTTQKQHLTIAILALVLLALVVMTLQLRRSQKAAHAANEAKSLFLATMSHEFRTPLNGIMGMAQLTRFTDLTKEQEEYIDIVMQSANALLTIVNDILDISKIESGKLELENFPVAIDELMHNLVSFFELTALQKGLDFESKIDPNCPTSVIIDGSRIRQVLFNLLGNAVKFTTRGKVSISVSAIHLHNKDRLLFEVSDTGIGIPEERHHEIFEAFTQVDNSNNRKYGGTGLGLSISRSLVKLMEGDLYVESILNKGSVFSVSVPLIPINNSENSILFPKPSTPPFQKPAIAEHPIHVLVVDDNPTNLRTTQAIMQKLGHIATTAKDGVDALDIFKVGLYDLVLLDLQMPNLDGWETARLIRQKEAASNARVPIVALSAYPLNETTGHRVSSDMDGFLQKPIKMRLLIKEIARSQTHKKTGSN